MRGSKSQPSKRECESGDLQQLATDERPRERLLRHGSASLSESELLALVLRTGLPNLPVLNLARRLLRVTGGFSGLAATPPAALLKQGLGPARTTAVVAAVEIGRRLARARVPQRLPLDHPSRVARYLSLRYLTRDQEVMGSLFLDVRNRLMGECELYRGTLSRAAVEPRAILKEGLLRDAAGFVLFHTHPSGDPSPSLEDLSFTRRVAESGELLGVYLVDHIVIAAADRWVSLRQRGGW